MGKQRKDPSKRQQDAPDPAEDDVGGGGDNELDEMDDFDNFLRTIDDSSDSDEEEDEADPSEDDDQNEDNGDEEDDDDEDDEGVEPEEDEDLNEDEEEPETGEEDDQEEESTSEDQGVEEGEEGVPVTQNGIGNSEEEDSAMSSDDNDEGAGSAVTAKKHKMDLQKLQETDPEFFAFLKQNDKELLDFDDSDEGEDSDDDSDEEDALHKPPEALEEASDSEAEEERLDDTSDEHKRKVEKYLKKGVVDINVITYWQTQLSQTKEITVLTNVVEALQCAVVTLSQGETEGLKWRVDGSANFNALLRLCIKEVKGFCVRFLCGNNTAVSENRFDQKPFDVRDRSKQKWVRLRPKIKTYMEIMVQLFKCMGNPDAIASVLRHCLRMSGFWALMATKSYKLMRALVNIWSQGEDSCRVIAFLTIIRITNYSKDVFLLHMFKQMYIAYVANCKFTSVNTWPAINFMRSSLVELYLLDTGLAYSVAFPFIRQLAIHLRNALSPNTVQQNEGKQKKSEASRVVYSWQFVHSLHLWADVLAQAGATQDENLKLLVYPVVQICMGTIKLIPTKKFIPIRFHIVRMLIKLQDKAGVFVPVLPIITEVLRLTDFSNKSASKFSVRPIDLSCCLKADASETGYLKAVSDNVFETILLYCKAIGTDLGFPEIVTPTAMFLRGFLKKSCKNMEVNKRFKTLLEKIDANSKYISERRNKALENGTVTLADKKSHRILQVQMQTSKPPPPILAYATEYFKLNQKAQVKARRPAMETREERLIPKPSANKKQQDESTSKSSKIPSFSKPMFMDSHSDNSDEEDSHFTTKLDSVSEEQGNKKKKKLQKKRKLQEADSDEEDEDNLEEDSTTKPEKKKKKKDKLGKGKKKKVSKNISLDFDNDVQDELVDFELSD